MNLKQLLSLPTLPFNPVITSLELDSRLVKPGACFIAKVGSGQDGRAFMQKAKDQGAVAIVYEAENVSDSQQQWIDAQQGYPLMAISGLNEQISSIAARFYGSPSEHMHVIAVTGTNGKSSIAHGITQLYTALYEPCIMIGTLGMGPLDQLAPNSLTTPDSITLQKTLAQWQSRGYETAAMEASSHAIDQLRLRAVNVHTAIFTNLTRDHLDYHKTMEAYGEAKAKLYQMNSVEYAIFNLDDPWCKAQVQKLPPNKIAIGYTLTGQSDPRCVRVLAGTRDDHTLLLCWGDARVSVHVPLLGEFNFSNVLAMIAALLADGFTLDEITPHVARLTCIPGRLQKALKDADPCVIIDYAHTPDALEKALQSVRAYAKNRLICIFGCGGDRDVGKRKIMGSIAGRLADYTIITNDNPRSENPELIAQAIEEGLDNTQQYHIQLDRKQAIEEAIAMAQPGDCILIAGKGHEKEQIIGDERFHHDDVHIAQSILSEKLHEAK